MASILFGSGYAKLGTSAFGLLSGFEDSGFGIQRTDNSHKHPFPGSRRNGSLKWLFTVCWHCVTKAAAMRLLRHFFRKEDRFFRLLEASAEEGVASVKALQQILESPAPGGHLGAILQARDKERQIRTEIDVLLCEGEAAPLPPEDIEALARALYRIPKGIKKFAERYVLCAPRLQDVTFAQEMKMLQAATEAVCRMVTDLRNGSNLYTTELLNEALGKIEGEADKLLVTTLDQLYRGRHDLVKAVMLKDLHELLERVFDRCRNAGNILLQIAMKRS